jgi:flagellar biosynthesis GTPase FlhF
MKTSIINPKNIEKIYEFMTKGATPSLEEVKKEFLPDVDGFKGNVLVVFKANNEDELDTRCCVLMPKYDYDWWKEHSEHEFDLPNGDYGSFDSLEDNMFEDPYVINELVNTTMFSHNDAMEKILEESKGMIEDEDEEHSGSEDEDEEEEEEEDEEEEEEEEEVKNEDNEEEEEVDLDEKKEEADAEAKEDEDQEVEKKITEPKKRKIDVSCSSGKKFLILGSKKAKV